MERLMSDKAENSEEGQDATSTGGQLKPVTLFYSYSHEDQAFREKLAKHLMVLKRGGLIAPWHDREIMPGEDWTGKIDEHLNSADIILFLVSPSFLASEYCSEREVTRALERHELGEARSFQSSFGPACGNMRRSPGCRPCPKMGSR
jgi:internalin A